MIGAPPGDDDDGWDRIPDEPGGSIRATPTDPRKLREKLRRDPKHYWVEGTARLATAKRLAEKLRKEMGFAQYNAERYKLANARSHVGQDVGKFEQALEGMALDTKTHDALVEMYEQLLISALPEHHSLKRTLHREGIYGWDKNMRAVFAKTAQTGAWALSRMMHVSDLQQAMSELDEMSKTGEPNAQDARALHNELLARQDLRHLLKHTRTYCAASLTPTEKRVLKRTSWLRDLWFRTGKPVYRFLTRRVLKWEDNEGQGPKP